MIVTWAVLKSFVDVRNLSIQWVDLNESYQLYAFDGSLQFECLVNKGEAEGTEFESSYKANGNKSFTDIDGTTMIRPKAAKKGWTYQLLPIEFITGKLNSVHCEDVSGNSRSGITYKIYDVDNTEITVVENEPNAVKTVVDYEPAFDYEVIGGHIQQFVKPDTNIRIWVIAVPDIPANYGGSKEMVGGVNLKFIDPTDKITADGRATKLLSYSATYHTNKLRFVFKHDAGIQHEILVILETYKA